MTEIAAPAAASEADSDQRFVAQWALGFFALATLAEWGVAGFFYEDNIRPERTLVMAGLAEAAMVGASVVLVRYLRRSKVVPIEAVASTNEEPPVVDSGLTFFS